MAAIPVSVVNLGCRVNRVESDHMTMALARAGYAIVAAEEADVVVVNTCAVTGEAEAKTRKAVRRALGLSRHPYVVATGCAANLHPDELRSLSDRVTVEGMKTEVARCVRELVGEAASEGPEAPESAAPPHGPALTQLLGRSRLGVKIQDGCNHRCSYCIVWKARGPERSVSLEDVLAQVCEAERAGVPEVVLTGVNLGAYRWPDRSAGAEADPVGTEAPMRLEDLIDAILERTEIGRVRLSSIEPMDVSEGLIERMASWGERVAPFLHLPLQSGCTSTLRRMYRPYTAEAFEELCGRLRQAMPAIALSCDVIAGFPGETDEEFEASRALCERVGFSRMHVFRYSARPGTPAALAADQVPPQVSARRSAVLRALADRMARADATARIGSIEPAVIEDAARGIATLGSFHKLRVVPGADGAGAGERFALREGAMLRVAIMGLDDDGMLIGRPVATDE